MGVRAGKDVGKTVLVRSNSRAKTENLVYSWELKVALCVMEICTAKQGGEGRRATGDKGTVPGKEPFALLRSLDFILRVTGSRGRVACKEVSPLD